MSDQPDAILVQDVIIFKDGLCNIQAIPMNKIKGFERHFSRCSRIEEINWDTPISSSSQFETIPPGDVVLKIDNLKKYYEVAANALFGSSGTYKTVKANETLSFEARESETLAIVGESGCGKSTLAKMLAGLISPSSGEIKIQDKDINNYEQYELPNHIQYMFQDPISSLNPRKTIYQSLAAPLKYLRKLDEKEIEKEIKSIIKEVNLKEEFLNRFPHEFSGGQAQRIGIARVLLSKAKIIILDEPVSALDVSVQSQILNLLNVKNIENLRPFYFDDFDLNGCKVTISRTGFSGDLGYEIW